MDGEREGGKAGESETLMLVQIFVSGSSPQRLWRTCSKGLHWPPEVQTQCQVWPGVTGFLGGHTSSHQCPAGEDVQVEVGTSARGHKVTILGSVRTVFYKHYSTDLQTHVGVPWGGCDDNWIFDFNSFTSPAPQLLNTGGHRFCNTLSRACQSQMAYWLHPTLTWPSLLLSGPRKNVLTNNQHSDLNVYQKVSELDYKLKLVMTWLQLFGFRIFDQFFCYSVDKSFYIHTKRTLRTVKPEPAQPQWS